MALIKPFNRIDFHPARMSGAFTSRLDSYSQLTTEEHDAINRGTAKKCFPGFDSAP